MISGCRGVMVRRRRPCVIGHRFVKLGGSHLCASRWTDWYVPCRCPLQSMLVKVNLKTHSCSMIMMKETTLFLEEAICPSLLDFNLVDPHSIMCGILRTSTDEFLIQVAF